MVSNRIQLILSLLFCLLFTQALNAQVRISDIQRNNNNYYEWGFLTGSNFQQLSAFPFANNYSHGNVSGAYIKRRKKLFGLQSAITLSTTRYQTELPISHKYKLSHTLYPDTVSKGDFNIYYANIPLIIEIRPVKDLSLQMGITYSYLAKINDNNGAYSKIADTKNIFNRSNFSATAGFEFELSQRLKFEATYSIGLMDVNGRTFQGLTDRWITNSGSFCLMYRFKKWYPPLKHIKKR